MAGPGAAEAEMPATVAAAWGVRERPHKGPKPALSLARIVDAGVRIADTEGLDAVSMGRVAAELKAAPMSLYRHVSSKEELIKLMVDAAWDDSPGSLLSGENWGPGCPAGPGPCGPPCGGTPGRRTPRSAGCRSCRGRSPGSRTRWPA